MILDPNTIHPGQLLPEMPVPKVSADDAKIFALILGDPNPIHYDREAVRAAGLGDRLVNQGGATMAYLVTWLAGLGGDRAAVLAVECSFRANVFVGDDVRCGGSVAAVRPGVDGMEADLQVWVDVVDGARAITGTATVRLRRD